MSYNEDGIRELANAFRALFGLQDQCAALLTRDQVVLDATPMARRIFGLAHDGPVPIPQFPRPVEQAIESALRGEVVRTDIRVNGGMTYEVVAQPMQGARCDGSGIQGALLLAYDVTGQRRNEWETRLLSQIALAVGQTENVSLAITRTLQRICEATGWDLGEAWVPRFTDHGGGGTRLEYRGGWSRSDPQLEVFASQAGGLRFNKGEGIPGTAWATGTHLWVSDLRHSAEFTRGALAALAGFRAAVAVPLVDGADAIAVLVFFTRNEDTRNDELVHLAATVAAPLALLLKQKETEEAHRRAEARFAGMVAIASDAIISIDTSRRITLFNWGAEQIFRYTAAEMIGQQLDVLLPENLRGRHAAHIASFAKSPQTTRRMGERSTIVGQRKNGEIFPAEASISRFSIDGEWIYTVIMRDISERVRIEEELRVLAERMREAAAARDEVMALVSHDLRNPLNTVSICLSGLREDPPPPPEMAEGLVVLAQDSLALMSRMIQDLLDVASIDAGKLSLERTSVPLEPLLRRAFDMHRMSAAEDRIDLRLEVPSEIERAVVDVDAERVIQVLSNLIGNACKFTEAGGRVTISALRHPGAVQVTVHDTGRGIPVDAIPHVFDRFWYARRGAKQRSTGLGLAIARGIIEAHDGRIWVESTVGAGSDFHFTVPLAVGVPIVASPSVSGIA